MENLVLYRKYRPRTFAEVVGQEHVVRTIKNALKEKRVSHAYLFSGPRGTGKTTIARLLAKALNCSSVMNGEPCDKCEHCKEVNLSRALDLIEIDAASNRGIDEIRNLKESVRFGATKGPYKIYLVDEVHMLTKEAFNAFLKTLEEPPPFTVFVLATTEAYRLPATVISRTQRYDFRRLTIDELSERLETILSQEKVKAEKGTLRLIAREADGSVRDAESLLGQLLSVNTKKEVLTSDVESILGLVSDNKVAEFVNYLVSVDKSGAITNLQNIIDAGHEPRQFLNSLNNYLRRLLLTCLGDKLATQVKNVMSDENFKVLSTQAQTLTPIVVSKWLQMFSSAKNNLESYPMEHMAIEVTLVDLLGDVEKKTALTPPESRASAPKPKNESISSGVDVFLSNWENIAQELTSYNHSLSAFVKSTLPTNLEDGVLTLSTKYSFHKERLGETKNRRALEEAVDKITGQKLKIRCVLIK